MPASAAPVSGTGTPSGPVRPGTEVPGTGAPSASRGLGEPTSGTGVPRESARPGQPTSATSAPGFRTSDPGPVRFDPRTSDPGPARPDAEASSAGPGPSAGAETLTSETHAPDPSAPDTSAPDPSVPETSAPQPSAPDTSVPDDSGTGLPTPGVLPSGAVAGGKSPASGPRPADEARQALRAARAGSRQGTEGRAAGETPARAGRRPGRAGERGGGGRARELRELLAGAFRMPSEDDTGVPDEASRHHPDPHAHNTAAPEPASPPPAAVSVPRTMAAPSRDGDHRRTFHAFPPRTATTDAPGFAETWWGNAWVTALEEGALDTGRLARGRGYAQQGNVDAITVTPGLVLAYVRGSRPRPYRVQVRLRTFGDDEWERFLDAAVERPAHIAALLDKEMPQSLAECGVPLLPGPGDLDPHCSCPDRGHPCKHAAALCYQTARLLDADPFVLLLLRGRGERELLDALSRRNATRAARAAQEQQPHPLPGVRATDALAERRLPPLPAPLPVPAHPEQPPAYPSAPGGPDSFALDQLATDAAARAHALLATGHDEIGDLTLWQDAVRLAAARPGSGLTAATRSLYASLASAAGRTPAELARAVAAWRQGGPDGLTVLEEPWDPPAGRFDRARPLLLAADLPAFRPWHNHLTHPGGHVQLRFGRDGLWYAYESEPGHDDWWPRGTPDPDPVGALTGLGGADDL